MAVYAKIDTDGNVLEFPYRVRTRIIPEDAVKCDTSSKKPKVKWYEGLWYDRVEKESDNYVVYYTIGLKKYSSINEKKQTLMTLIQQARLDSLNSLKNNKIDELQHEKNIQLLDSIDVNDETTYDKYDEIVV